MWRNSPTADRVMQAFNYKEIGHAVTRHVEPRLLVVIELSIKSVERNLERGRRITMLDS